MSRRMVLPGTSPKESSKEGMRRLEMKLIGLKASTASIIMHSIMREPSAMERAMGM